MLVAKGIIVERRVLLDEDVAVVGDVSGQCVSQVNISFECRKEG